MLKAFIVVLGLFPFVIRAQASSPGLESDNLKSGTIDSNCPPAVYRGIICDRLFDKGYSVTWNFGAYLAQRPETAYEAVKIDLNSREQPFAGRPAVKLDYSWNAGRQTETIDGQEKEISAYELVFHFDNEASQLPFPAEKSRLGLWVYGNGSGDKLLRVLPVDWTGWRYVEIADCGRRLFYFPVLRAGQGEERRPLFFGPAVLMGKIGTMQPDLPARRFPYPFYLAADELISLQVANGAYDLEIQADARVTEGEMPRLIVNDASLEVPADGLIRHACDAKHGFITLRSICRKHWFTGFRYIKLSRAGRTAGYVDAARITQAPRQLAPVAGARARADYKALEPALETNQWLFEDDLGGKQLAADNRIVYQFKVKPAQYRVRLRFNRWRGVYPQWAAFDVFIQGKRVMRQRGPNKQLLVKDFPAGAPEGHIQIAILGDKREAVGWLGDIGIFEGDRLAGYVQPRSSVAESESGNYHGLRNLVPNPGFETEQWERHWQVLSSSNQPMRADSTAHRGKWALRLERTTGPAGLVARNHYTAEIVQRIKAGALANGSGAEKLGLAYEIGPSGAPVDYTKKQRFSAWVKTEEATGDNFMQIVWIAYPRVTPAEKPLVAGTRLYRFQSYFSILGVSESPRVSGSSDWQQLAVDAKPPYGATHAVFVLRADNNQGRIYFDDLDFDGFGNEPLDIVLPQIGYHPQGEKQALVQTKTPLKNGTFRILNQDGQAMFSGKVRPLETDSWGRCLSQADFTACRAEGRYRLEIKAGAITAASTPFFMISSNLYRDLGMLSVTGYLQIARCGVEIPGWHPACHQDDAAVRNQCGQQVDRYNNDPARPAGAIIKHADLRGGWHDAGSLDKNGLIMDVVAVNLCRFWRDAGFESHALGEKYPDIISQICWGLDYSMRSIDREAGYIYDIPVDWDPVTLHDTGLGSNPTDNIVNTDDDRLCLRHVSLQTAISSREWDNIPFALLRASEIVRKYDPAEAARMVDTARLWSPTGSLETAIAFYRADEKSLQGSFIEEQVRRKTAYYRALKMPNFIARGTGMGEMDLLLDYLELFPDSALKAEIESLTADICRNIVIPLAENNVYGVVDQMGEQVMTRAQSPVPDFNNLLFGICPSKYAQTAYFLARAGRLLRDPELVKLAERHVQYLLGRNPTGLSMVNGAGYRVYAISTLLLPLPPQWIENKGRIPGGLGSFLTVSDGSCNWLSFAPLDFPVPQAASELADTPLGSGEVWEVPAGWFIAACGALDRAMREVNDD